MLFQPEQVPITLPAGNTLQTCKPALLLKFCSTSASRQHLASLQSCTASQACSTFSRTFSNPEHSTTIASEAGLTKAANRASATFTLTTQERLQPPETKESPTSWKLADFSGAAATPENCPFNCSPCPADWHCVIASPPHQLATATPWVHRSIRYSCGWCSAKVCANCNVHLHKSSKRVHSSLGTQVATVYCLDCWECLQTRYLPLGTCRHCQRHIWPHYYGVDRSSRHGRPNPWYYHPDCERRHQELRIRQAYQRLTDPDSEEDDKENVPAATPVRPNTGP